jgi:thioredoxin-dependent peroxiredoxin
MFAIVLISGGFLFVDRANGGPILPLHGGTGEGSVLAGPVVGSFLPIKMATLDSAKSLHWEPLMGDWVESGQRAPAFALTADDGGKVRLSDFKGRPVVLYFYPKDDTPGCTREACAFRDQQAVLKKMGVTVLGVSPDSTDSHARFRDKYRLNFPLLADENHTVAEKYGAWREKNMYGKKSMGVARSTFLIDATGKVAKVWKQVKVDGHDEQVLAALAQLE